MRLRDENMKKKDIQKIEELPLSLNARVEILLVCAGEKPATQIDAYTEIKVLVSNEELLKEYNTTIEETESYEISRKKYENLLETLKEIGMHIHIHDQVNHTTTVYRKPFTSYTFTPISVSLSEKTLLKFVTALKEKDTWEEGRLYGFPETAIQAFHGELERYEGDTFDHRPQEYFEQFIFSKEHYQEEYMNTSLRWYNTVKKHSPRLIEEIKEYQDAVRFEYELIRTKIEFEYSD
jgi:hypothetical protein